MEFLIAIDPKVRSSANDNITLSQCNLQSHLDGSLRTYQSQGFFAAVTAQSDLSIHKSSVFCDGFGVIANQAFSTAKPNNQINPALENYITQATPPKAAGVFCVMSINPAERSFTFKPDPLCQYTVFLYHRGDTFILSNNIFLMEDYCIRQNIPLTRTIVSTAFEAGLGLGAWDQTGFQQISALPIGTYVQCIQGTVNLQPHTYALLPNTNSLNYEQLVKIAANDLKNTLKAWREFLKGDTVVFDVTGGIDSRLTLAAARAIGWHDFGVFCTPNLSDDHLISNMICNHYDLKFAPFPQNFDGEDLTAVDIVKRAIFRQQGFSSLYNFELGKTRLKGVARVRGGYGEITRSFFNSSLSKTNSLTELSRNIQRIIKADPIIWGGLKTNTLLNAEGFIAARLANRIRGQQDFFTKGFKKHIIPTLMSQFQTLQCLGAPNSALPDIYYLADRAKRHFGYTAQQLNRVRPSIEPLCLPSIWHAALALGAEARSNATLAYDLFTALGQEELRDLPYEHNSWPKGANVQYYDRDKFPVNLSPLRTMNIKTSAPPKITSEPAPSGLTGHAEYLAPLIQYYSELVNTSDPSHSCWQTFDQQYLSHTLKTLNIETLSSRKAGVLMRLLHGLTWCTQQEDKVGINSY